MAEDSTERSSSRKSTGLNNRTKIVLGVMISAIVAVMATGAATMQNSIAQIDGENPTQGYDIHVTVNRHDSENLNASMDHYCKLDKRIVAVCLLYAKENAAMKDAGPQLAQVEFIISKDQYTKLPERERANWHNHAVELTPERGMPSCVSLPEGVECGSLVETLQGTYGKVITLWDPADAVPNYPPYVFAVDSPYALGQDLNNNLAKEWPTGCGNQSSADLSCEK
jgi:hypothetical protein